MTDAAVEAGVLSARDAGVGVALPLCGERTVEDFQRLYTTFFRDLSDYCARLLGDDHLARDVAQEAFTRLFARFLSVREPRAWLFLVATNLVRSEWRDRARHRRAAAVLAAGATATVSERDLGLSDLVARLPDRLARVVFLHYYADLSLQDIARITRAPLGTVKRRLSEGRAALLAALDER